MEFQIFRKLFRTSPLRQNLILEQSNPLPADPNFVNSKIFVFEIYILNLQHAEPQDQVYVYLNFIVLILKQ